MTRALLPALPALLALAGCDFDAAWESWCARTDCSAAAPDAGESLCGECPAGSTCTLTSGGAGVCRTSCTGYPGACGSGLDCKLLLGEDKAHLVPVCVGLGAGTGECSSVDECAEQRTCAQGSSGAFTCLELCNPYHPACTLDLPRADAGAPSDAGEPPDTGVPPDAEVPCASDPSMPAGWGVCRK